MSFIKITCLKYLKHDRNGPHWFEDDVIVINTSEILSVKMSEIDDHREWPNGEAIEVCDVYNGTTIYVEGNLEEVCRKLDLQ